MRFQKERGMEVMNVVKERDVRGRLSRQGYLESWSACGHFCALDFVLTYKEQRSAMLGILLLRHSLEKNLKGTGLNLSPFPARETVQIWPLQSRIYEPFVLLKLRDLVFDSLQEPEGPVG